MKAIISIQPDFVECPSASHDALDKATFNGDEEEEEEEEEEGKEGSKSRKKIRIYHLQLLDPLDPSVRERSIYTTTRPIKPFPSTLLPTSPLIASPPHSSFILRAWGRYISKTLVHLSPILIVPSRWLWDIGTKVYYPLVLHGYQNGASFGPPPGQLTISLIIKRLDKSVLYSFLSFLIYHHCLKRSYGGARPFHRHPTFRRIT